ncbi:MAG: AAA family ATPase [Rhodobacteraceae bacterium]|nr:AAA family ATPase [Paracoccaceae bacterium]
MLAQFVSSRLADTHFEGRGLVLTAGTRSGKSHDIKHLLKGFAENPSALPGGLERKYARISLRTTTAWKHLGSALLKASGYFSDLDHRSSDMIWRRTEDQLKRKGIFIVHIDESQHTMHDKSPKEIKTILDGLKDLMKRPEWPILLILSGIPTLLQHLNESDELIALLEPISYSDIAYNQQNLEEADGIMCSYGAAAKLDVSGARDEDTYNRMIHGTARRWGRFIEMVIQSMAHAKAAGKTDLSRTDLAETFGRWTGACDSANVMLIENPYRIDPHKLFQS